MIYIEEKQYFRQKWLWVIILFFPLFSFYGIYEQIMLGNPIGNNPASDMTIWLFSIFAGLGFPLLFYFMMLKIKITDKGLHYQFFPIHLKEYIISFDQIKTFKSRKYSPLKEFGGWGIKYGFESKAYNVSGNIGVQIVLKDGNKILFGSQNSNEIIKAMKLAIKKENSFNL